MRLLLALALMVSASEGYAACSQAKLAGEWEFSRPFIVCKFTIGSFGAGTGKCTQGKDFEVFFSLTPLCKFHGSIHEKRTAFGNDDQLRGRADSEANLIVGTSLVLKAPFTAFRSK